MTELSVGELRVRSGPSQADRLLEWAAPLSGANLGDRERGLGRLLGPAARRCPAGGWLKCASKVAARVRLLGTEAANKDASMAPERSPTLRCGRSSLGVVRREGHTALIRLCPRCHGDLSPARNSCLLAYPSNQNSHF